MFRSLSHMMHLNVVRQIGHHIPLLLLDSSHGAKYITRAASRYVHWTSCQSMSRPDWRAFGSSLRLRKVAYGFLENHVYTVPISQNKHNRLDLEEILLAHFLTSWTHRLDSKQVHWKTSALGSSIPEIILTFVLPCPHCFSWPLSPASMRWGESCCIVWRAPTYRKLESFTRPGKEFPQVDRDVSS